MLQWILVKSRPNGELAWVIGSTPPPNPCAESVYVECSMNGFSLSKHGLMLIQSQKPPQLSMLLLHPIYRLQCRRVENVCCEIEAQLHIIDCRTKWILLRHPNFVESPSCLEFRASGQHMGGCYVIWYHGICLALVLATGPINHPNPGD